MSRAAAKLAQDLLTTADAARILDLSTDMVRLLARNGRLAVAAESVRGLRLFRREDVDALAAERAGQTALQHIVQFYAGEDFLVRILADFLKEGMRSRGPILVIATKRRVQAVLELLASEGGERDARRARESGQLTILDARETLETFTVKGSPDAELFQRHVGGRIEDHRKSRARLRVYGEMVDVLCRDGRIDDAIHFEELWNELAGGYRLSRLCAYSIGDFQTGDHAPAFERICELHTRVAPTERYLHDRDPEARLRRIAVLEQRAYALSTEMELRQRTEVELREMKAMLRMDGSGPLAKGAVQ